VLKKISVIVLTLLLLSTVFITGCGAQVEEGNTVRVDYTGTLDDGIVFDTSIGREPLEFTVGAGEMITGFDEAVVGMKEGEIKTVTILAADAYGESSDAMIMEVPKTDFPPDLNPQVGDQLQMTAPDGSVLVVRVTDETETTATLDGNHPLAGQDLIFEITLIEIK